MRIFCIVLIGLFSFYAQAHVGLPVAKGVKANVVTDGIYIHNQTGHTIKLHKVRCNGKKVQMMRLRSIAGRITDQPVNFIVLPEGRNIAIAPPDYLLLGLHNCNSIRLNFGPQGDFTVR